MQPETILLFLVLFVVASYRLGRQRSLATAGGERPTLRLHSLPSYYGYFTAIWCLLPGLAVISIWLALEPRVITAMMVERLPEAVRNLSPGALDLAINDIRNLAAGDIVSSQVDADMQAAADFYLQARARSRLLLTIFSLGLALAGAAFAWSRVRPGLRARNHVERILRYVLVAASSIAILTTVGIVLSVLFEAILFFRKVPISEFLFGLEWSPQTAIRADQVGSSGAFGAVPLFTGTLLVTAIAMLVAVPIGLMTAIYLSEYSRPGFRATAKPLLEVLAGIPTVVYGFFAALTVAPLIRRLGTELGLEVASESALAAGLVMGIMIIPLVSSLSDDAITAVPRAMRDGSLGLGATRSETVKLVILPAALPGIVGGILLAVSRAIGETMIVVMAAGLAANLTANPLEAVTTVTVQIVTLLVGDQEFDSAKTLAAFALGLVLFLVTLVLNVIGLRVVRKYREQYE